MFVKLFDTPNGQFLAMIDTVDDEEVIVLRGESRQGVWPSMTLSGYPSEVERDAEFDAIDQDKADKSAADFVLMIANLMAK